MLQKNKKIWSFLGLYLGRPLFDPPCASLFVNKVIIKIINLIIMMQKSIHTYTIIIIQNMQKSMYTYTNIIIQYMQNICKIYVKYM